MSVAINPHNYSYERSVFDHPSKLYDSYQENGTKYLKIRKPLEENLKQQLNACVGEIFLSGIPPDTRAEQIAEIAAVMGEIYILRFKVNFSGNSRGFAYLQYMNPELMPKALERLPSLYRQYSFPTVKVRQSRNSSKLLLKKTHHRMRPLTVFENLKKLINFQKLVGRELFPGYFEYQIIFKCNEEAVHARRELLRSISSFGRNALVVWDTSDNGGNHMTNICRQFDNREQTIWDYSTAPGSSNVYSSHTSFENKQIISSSLPQPFANMKFFNPLNMELF